MQENKELDLEFGVPFLWIIVIDQPIGIGPSLLLPAATAVHQFLN